ncbi:hypothetical protein D3C85_1626410 [compost metagenome]
MPVKHILDLLGGRIHVGLRDMLSSQRIILKQAVNIRFVEEAPIEEGDSLTDEPLSQLINRGCCLGPSAGETVIDYIRKRHPFSGEPVCLC